MKTHLTFHDRLILADNRPSGFDYMRLVLALLIVVFHSYEISYGPYEIDHPLITSFRAMVAILLPMFFALSGFLVAGSLERSPNLKVFLGLRFLRIFPALTVEVFLCALILGPIFTLYPLSEYFSDPLFINYFLNIIGEIQYHLPTVFEGNPVHRTVNAQLWTVPYELFCYVALFILAFIGTKRLCSWLTALLIGYVILFLWTDTSLHDRIVCVNGVTLILVFLSGVIFYNFRKQVPSHPWIFLLSLALSILFLSSLKWDLLAAIPCAYITIYLGLFNPQRTSWITKGDYSYGIFLYGFPIQQAVASISPAFHEWYWNTLISLPYIFLCAYLSWHYVEKPTLSLRRHLMRGVQRIPISATP